MFKRKLFLIGLQSNYLDETIIGLLIECIAKIILQSAENRVTRVAWSISKHTKQILKT